MVLSAVATLTLLLGLLALAYNGYTEDAGSSPAETLDLAITLLAIAVALFAAAIWRLRDYALRAASIRVAGGAFAGVVVFGVALSIVYG